MTTPNKLDDSLFEAELLTRREQMYKYLLTSEYRNKLGRGHLLDAFYSYLTRGGKSLRSALLLFCCGAVGGDEQKAIPAAAAVEVYHTMSLVHDDIVDKDEIRRGGPTIHIEFRDRAAREFRFPEEEARHYGVSIALLTGDLLHSLAISILCDLHTKIGIDPSLVISLVNDLTLDVGPTLVEGESLDLQYSNFNIETVGEDAILHMLWQKTGALYQFSGSAGAMIGVNKYDRDMPVVKALSEYSASCGIAFQLQDDILGLIGKQDELGKPIGSDIREGKRTAIVDFALKRASEKEKAYLIRILGNRRASKEETDNATELLRQLGGIDHARGLAERHIDNAIKSLQKIPNSRYRELLYSLSQYIIQRNF